MTTSTRQAEGVLAGHQAAVGGDGERAGGACVRARVRGGWGRGRSALLLLLMQRVGGGGGHVCMGAARGCVLRAAA